ncbi:MAG: L,D-transpeptidase [Desulfobaccales bacterium]
MTNFSDKEGACSPKERREENSPRRGGDMTHSRIRGLRSFACFAVLFWFLGLPSGAQAQETEHGALSRELAAAGFKVLHTGTAYGVPYVEIKVPLGDSVASICRRVPSLNLDFLHNRDKIAFFNGVHPCYLRTAEPEPFSLKSATLKIPLNPDLIPEIFPAFESSLASYEKFILIDMNKGFLALYGRGALIRVFPISGGRPDKRTPLIAFRVQAKSKDHWSNIYDVWMPWALLIKAPYYIHAGVLPGDNDSAGCIRLFHQDAEELYHLVEVGTPGRIIQASGTKPTSPQPLFSELPAPGGSP